MTDTALVWFRRDLRLQDNPALQAGLAHKHLIPLYIHAPDEAAPFAPGEATCWWLHHALQILDQDLTDQLGLNLILASGSSQKVIEVLVEKHDINAIYWNRRYEPALREVDSQIKTQLKSRDIQVESFGANLLFEPWEVENQQGDPYRVFTPFYKRCLQLPPASTVASDDSVAKPVKNVSSQSVEELGLLSRFPWYDKWEGMWHIGEQAAHDQLENFLDGTIQHYKSRRDFLGDQPTSTLSPYLHFGHISPRQVLSATNACKEESREGVFNQIEAFERQLYWRDFGHHLLYHFPNTPEHVFNENYADFPWKHDPEALETWQRGQTGVPMVDAGMRELWETGTMHNRARMIVASYLTKNLGIHWLEGARWFWNTLLDADLANNTLGWQWTAGCGADASPYYRIFNPVTQGQKFDAKGDYVRRWIPEIAHLSDKHIHAPWEAKTDLLQKPSSKSDKLPDYPNEPIVDLKASRESALAAYESWKNK